MPRFDMGETPARYDAVRAETCKFLDSISQSDLAKKPHPRGYAIRDMFIHLMRLQFLNVKDAALIRGIQRGIHE